MNVAVKQAFFPAITFLGRIREQRFFTDPPVLIGGAPRSGTTLLLSVLSSHRDIFACPRELGLFNQVLPGKDGAPRPARIDRLYRTLLTHRIPPDAKRWCEKSPGNIHRVEDIDSYFRGRFRMIQIIRDGRDVILSRHPKRPDEYYVKPEIWVRDVQQGIPYLKHPKMLTIRYEDLIRQYGDTIGKICGFLEMDLSPEIRDWHNHATVTRNKALFGKMEKLTDRSIGKWKSEESRQRVEQLTCIPEALELLHAFGYET